MIHLFFFQTPLDKQDEKKGATQSPPLTADKSTTVRGSEKETVYEVEKAEDSRHGPYIAPTGNDAIIVQTREPIPLSEEEADTVDLEEVKDEGERPYIEEEEMEETEVNEAEFVMIGNSDTTVFCNHLRFDLLW